jgi:hypothetical protein
MSQDAKKDRNPQGYVNLTDEEVTNIPSTNQLWMVLLFLALSYLLLDSFSHILLGFLATATSVDTARYYLGHMYYKSLFLPPL